MGLAQSVWIPLTRLSTTANPSSQHSGSEAEARAARQNCPATCLSPSSHEGTPDATDDDVRIILQFVERAAVQALLDGVGIGRCNRKGAMVPPCRSLGYAR